MAKKTAPSASTTKAQDERAKRLDAYLLKSKGAIVRIGEAASGASVPMRATGVLALDRLTRGLPKGRIVEVFGDASAGKTTLCLHATAAAQARGETVAIIDAEHALDLSYAEALRVNTADLLLAQPACGEDALDLVVDLATEGLVDIIIVDSVAALTPRAEIEGEMADSQMGAQARMMGKALRKINHAVSTNGVTVIFVNQVRMRTGVVFGNPETTPGGMALPFFASMRIQLRGSAAIKQGETRVGNDVKLTVVKNKVGRPYVKDTLRLRYGQGFDNHGWVLDRAIDLGVVEKSGSWFSFEGERLAQGRDAAVLTLHTNTEVYAKVLSQVMELLDASGVEAGGPDDE